MWFRMNIWLSMHSHTQVLVSLYVHPKLPIFISCIFFCVCVCLPVCVWEQFHVDASMRWGQPIHSKLPHLPHIYLCRCVRMLCTCVSLFQHAIKMSNDSCSLFTPQPSSLLPEICLPLVIESLGLSLLPYIKLLRRDGKCAEIFLHKHNYGNISKCPFSKLTSVRAEWSDRKALLKRITEN